MALCFSTLFKALHPFPSLFQSSRGFFTLVVSLTHLLLSSAWLKHRSQANSVANILMDMRSIGYKPDSNICNYLISSLCSIGELTEAFQVLKGMGGAGCVPDLESYGTLISAATAVRRTDKALNLLKEMVVKVKLTPRQGTIINVVVVIIVAKVTRDRALREWALEETAENMHRNFGSGYPGDPTTKCWSEDHKHSVFGFPTLVRFSWGTCTSYFKDVVEVSWESDKVDEDGATGGSGKKQLRLFL